MGDKEAVFDRSPSPLQRLLRPVRLANVDHAAGTRPPSWLSAGDWRLLARPRTDQPRGSELERFLLASGECVAAVLDEGGRPWIPFDLDEAFENYVSERWRDHAPPRGLTRRQLELYYRLKPLVPRSALLAARRAFVRRTRLPEFPNWPIDDSVWLLMRFYAFCVLAALQEEATEFIWFWPNRHHAALLLTHDVETAGGLRLALEIADLEEERGFRSSFNVVGSWYPIDHGVVRELSERGFEIGLHGLRHDHSLFSSHEEFVRQLPAISEALSMLGATGFRSPATHRVHDWIAELPVTYDSSVPHSDPFEPQPGGCCTLWPYEIGNVIELPYTAPQDHTLFNLLHERTVDSWLRQVEAIEARCGLIQFITHPDRGYLGDTRNRALYIELLTALDARSRLWRALPHEVAGWWKRRMRATAADEDMSLGSIRRDGDSAFAFLSPPA
jgi:peptidoglycan/xylan/chitin deacetylase (PgdA/CDA1 family)